MDFANIGSGALIFGNLISEKIDLKYLVTGILFYFVCFVVSYKFTRGNL